MDFAAPRLGGAVKTVCCLIFVLYSQLLLTSFTACQVTKKITEQGRDPRLTKNKKIETDTFSRGR